MATKTTAQQIDDLESLSNLTTPLDADGRQFLGRAQKFLLNVADPALGARAARFGYNGEQHALGWRLLSAASGAGRPFAHYLSEAEQEFLGADPAMKATIVELDAFENRWFPVIRVAIQRYVAPDKRVVAEEAFYKGLQQQPEGPLVVNSVAQLLGRYASFKDSGVAGVEQTVKALEEKGLTPAEVARINTLLATAKKAAAPQSPAVDAAQQRQAATDQLKAFEELKLWYRDWATTLRPELGYHDLVKLGLRQVKGGHKKPAAAEEDPSDG